MSEVLGHDKTSLQPDLLGNVLRVANQELEHFGPDEDIPQKLRNKISGELNALWQLGEVECVFSGLCHTIRSGQNAADKRPEFIDVATATTDGFWVTKFGRPGFEHWAVAWGFYEKSVALDGTKSRVDYYLHTRAAHNVVPALAIEEAFPEGVAFPDLYSTLTSHSDVLAEKMQAEGFFDLDAAEQRHFIDQSVEEAEDEAAKFGGTIKGQQIGLNGARAYLPEVAGEGGTYRPIDISSDAIKGVCNGLMVLVRQRCSRDYRVNKPEQLIDPTAGLCLIVRIDSETSETLGLPPDEIMYVPISGQEINMTFDAGTRMDM